MMKIIGMEDPGIEVAGAHKTEVFHAGIEVGIGHRARILKFTQDGIVETAEIAVWDDGLEDFLAIIRNAVLGRMKPCEDVSGTVVEFIPIKMVRMVGLDDPFGIDIGRTFAIESIGHQDMAGVNTLA